MLTSPRTFSTIELHFINQIMQFFETFFFCNTSINIFLKEEIYTNIINDAICFINGLRDVVRSLVCETLPSQQKTWTEIR